ncbi:unnamed protein product [Spirodela intermedia]|uniref:Uncharacterized protein n=1 Tax=Spirodela intermedia TaxID=51605 RepID=A0A7I8IHP8_SPIIN|nr:unnamed protein product [Spirodela intermedia]CAA6657403.1 unnamed protein product [Spirodela intermedia]
MESPVSHAGGEEPEARTPVVSSGTNLVAALSLRRGTSGRLVSCRGRYMPEMNLGVLKDMPMIRENACEKVGAEAGITTSPREAMPRKLLSSYKDLVDAVSQCTKARDSMRCYLKGSSASPLVQFSQLSQDNDDPGDGGGVPVFTSWALPYFVKLAQEIIDMFAVEISLKIRPPLEILSYISQLLVSASCSAVDCSTAAVYCMSDAQGAQADERNWSIELYEGEFNDLNTPNPPRIRGFQSNNPATEQINRNPTRETLHVYLTAWISDVNVDIMR